MSCCCGAEAYFQKFCNFRLYTKQNLIGLKKQDVNMNFHQLVLNTKQLLLMKYVRVFNHQVEHVNKIQVLVFISK